MVVFKAKEKGTYQQFFRAIVNSFLTLKNTFLKHKTLHFSNIPKKARYQWNIICLFPNTRL